MSDELKLPLIFAFAAVAIVGIVAAAVLYSEAIDAKAPVVESCVKHPATRQLVLR